MSQNKVVSLSQLAEITADLKKQGKKIAHCHGCFDLLHLGHMKHFESAKKIADVLIVTLTRDQYVNKGPGRPVFKEQQRMEAIAALGVVDYVALNDWPTAIETLHLLKPDFFVKGPDYKNREDDVTQNITLEEDAVKAVGGELYITEDVQFSSSKLISAHMSNLDESVQAYMSNLKKEFSGDDAANEIEKLKDIKVLVIGDTIIDEYHHCTPLGKSSKSPTISTIYKYGNAYAGGVLAIANHISQYCSHVEMITCLGTENPQIDLIEKKLDQNVRSTFFYRTDGPTPTKRRYLDTYLDLKLFEVTYMNDKRIDSVLEQKIIDYINDIQSHYDLILVADFGHGLITPAIIKCLAETGKFLSVNAQTNSNNFGFNYITKYFKADYISIDEKELRLPFGDNYGALEDLIHKLADITHCNNIQITLGASGSIFYDGKDFYRTPAFATLVKDSVGAGDAVLSVTSLLAFNKAPAKLIGFIGNCVGAMAVEIIGNEHPVYKDKLKKYVSYFLK